MSGYLKVTVGDLVIMREAIDDVEIAQPCKVVHPEHDDGIDDAYIYQNNEPVYLLCWTGYLVWATRDQLIHCKVVDAEATTALEELFAAGQDRHENIVLSL